MERPLNFHHLHYFRVIAEVMSVTEAAAILKLAPSTLSDQLKAFEDELNVTLFERKPRLKLTREGRIVLEHARSIITEAKRLQRRLLSTQKTVPVVILIQEGFPVEVSRQIISRLRDHGPLGLTIQYMCGDPRTSLPGQRFDLALVLNMISNPAYDNLLLDEAELIVSVSPGASLDRIETIFLPPSHLLDGPRARSWVEENSVAYKHMIEASDPEDFLTGRDELVFLPTIPSGYSFHSKVEGCRQRFLLVRPVDESPGPISELFALLREQ